jgi:hypothetical protein
VYRALILKGKSTAFTEKIYGNSFRCDHQEGNGVSLTSTAHKSDCIDPEPCLWNVFQIISIDSSYTSNIDGTVQESCCLNLTFGGSAYCYHQNRIVSVTIFSLKRTCSHRITYKDDP